MKLLQKNQHHIFLKHSAYHIQAKPPEGRQCKKNNNASSRQKLQTCLCM